MPTGVTVFCSGGEEPAPNPHCERDPSSITHWKAPVGIKFGHSPKPGREDGLGLRQLRPTANPTRAQDGDEAEQELQLWHTQAGLSTEKGQSLQEPGAPPALAVLQVDLP